MKFSSVAGWTLAVCAATQGMPVDTGHESVMNSRRRLEAVDTKLAARESEFQRVVTHHALPLSRIYKKYKVCTPDDPTCAEQVHIQLGGPKEMVVVWVTGDAGASSTVHYGTSPKDRYKMATGQAAAYSTFVSWTKYMTGHGAMGKPQLTNHDIQEVQDTSSWAKNASFSAAYFKPDYTKDPFVDEKTGQVNWEIAANYMNPAEYYNSAAIHTVHLQNLEPGTTYYYTVGLSNNDTIFNFTMPMDACSECKESLVIGLTADLGQTVVSENNVQQLARFQPDVVFLAGDLSYADGYDARWDSYALMMQQLGAYVPVMTTPGNHETSAGYENGKSYEYRYPMPFRQSKSISQDFWSRDIGPVHLISLSSYAATNSQSLQFKWLLADLEQRFDREKTPWLFVIMHAPWYNSNEGHRNEALLMRFDMEDLFYKYGVDVVLSGHVHSYERMNNVYRNQVDACGPIYLNLGDGGNHEGAYVPWVNPQPDWSAFREASFGVGRMEVFNATHSLYEWHRNACNDKNAPYGVNFDSDCVTTDDNSKTMSQATEKVWFVRDQSARTCGNRGPRFSSGNRAYRNYLSKITKDTK